jgi:hypothetical protein
VVGVGLVLPPAAFACKNGVSAVAVYSECVPNGGGGKSAGHGHSTTGTHTSGATQTSGGSTSSTSVPISKQTAKALKKAGSDGKSLSNLVKGYGAARLLQSSSAPVTSPTAVGSAFDLGSGPTALLIVLAGTAVVLLTASGFSFARQRRH